jgi:hypothetical protein
LAEVDLIGILSVPSSEHRYIGLPQPLLVPLVPSTLTERAVLVELGRVEPLGRVELQEGEGDIKTADGGGVLALTGVLDRLSRHLSAVFMSPSPSWSSTLPSGSTLPSSTNTARSVNVDGTSGTSSGCGSPIYRCSEDGTLRIPIRSTSAKPKTTSGYYTTNNKQFL